jgi:hypothetical protein
LRRAIAGHVIVAGIALFASMPVMAQAKSVHSTVNAEIFATVDQRATVVYYYGGTVGVQGLSFRCLGNRQVMLFRVESGGKQKKVAATSTSFFGRFFAPLEKRLAAVPGHYYARVKPRVRRLKKGRRLRCLGARSPAFFVDVPSGLLSRPAALGG